MESTTDGDVRYMKRFWEDFEKGSNGYFYD